MLNQSYSLAILRFKWTTTEFLTAQPPDWRRTAAEVQKPCNAQSTQIETSKIIIIILKPF